MQDRTQEFINLERCKELYPNGFGMSGMAAIGNGGVNYYHGTKRERPTKNTNGDKRSA